MKYLLENNKVLLFILKALPISLLSILFGFYISSTNSPQNLPTFKDFFQDAELHYYVTDIGGQIMEDDIATVVKFYLSAEQWQPKGAIRPLNDWNYDYLYCDEIIPLLDNYNNRQFRAGGCFILKNKQLVPYEHIKIRRPLG